MGSLAALSESQAEAYKEARPTYPNRWYKMLAEKTKLHNMAWDVGTGNGQAAVGVAEYYKSVKASDISLEQVKRATKHPRVTYLITPESLSEDELVSMIGGESSVDLVTAAQAVHYFDLPKFYAVVKRVLRKPGGVVAVWVFNRIVVSLDVDRVFKRLEDSTVPFRTPKMNIAFEGYRTLSFPFDSIGIGSQGNPKPLDLNRKLSLEGFLAFLRSWQPVVKAKELNVNLLTDRLLSEFVTAWGPSPTQDVVYKVHMIAGTCKPEDSVRRYGLYGQSGRTFKNNLTATPVVSKPVRASPFHYTPTFPPPFISDHMMLPPPPPRPLPPPPMCPCSLLPPGTPTPPCRYCNTKRRPQYSYGYWY